MRTEPAPKNYAESDDHPGIRIVDWKDNAADVLEAVDDLLKAHGLEIVFLDARDDAYHFRIEEIAA